MKIGFLQYQPEFGEVNKNLDRVEALIKGSDADLLVLPELFNTGYVFTSREEALHLSEEIPGSNTVARLCTIAKREQCNIVAGIAEKDGGRIYNSAVLIAPEGFISTYRKIHLFSEEKLWFDPGDRPFAVWDIGSCRLGIMICFDWFFPESMRILALKGADIICHPANLVLPFCQNSMATRCLENRVFAITANRTGVEDRGEGKSLSFTGMSQISGPDGTILIRSQEETEGIGISEIDPHKARDKHLNPFNDLFADRRPEFYNQLTADSKIKK
jgi:5-aminopentanamidase